MLGVLRHAVHFHLQFLCGERALPVNFERLRFV
jgi:hypothetical protein